MVSIVLVGIGGYGYIYVKELLKENPGYKIVGAVDPKPENCEFLPEMKKRGIPIYNSIEDFYAVHTADLAILSSPIQFHCSQTCFALSKGSNVLCEKPLAATIQEGYKMLEARDKYNKFVAIGYQWSYSKAIQDLKKDIMDGLFGAPKRLKTLVFWPRNAAYYSRGWAGRKKDSNGNWILDSVANNATAHYLHNMFYVLGPSFDRSAVPVQVKAELYRANNIENFDTAVINTVTEEGAEIYFYVTHAVNVHQNPTFRYEFEKGTVTYGGADPRDYNFIRAVFNDGTEKIYGDPNAEKETVKIHAVIASVAEGKPVACGIEAAMSHTVAINGAQDSMREIVEFPRDIVKYDEEKQVVWVEGLAELLRDCYENWTTPSEKGISWAKAGDIINLKGYMEYKG